MARLLGVIDVVLHHQLKEMPIEKKLPQANTILAL